MRGQLIDGEKKKLAETPGRKPPPGVKKQMLTSMDAQIIKKIKAAAAMRGTTASLVMEQVAAERLERRQDGKK